MLSKIIAAVLILILGINTASATTWYVNSALGNDANNGKTLGTPFLTLQKAANSTATGDTVYILPGVGYGGGTSGTAPLTISTSGSGAGTTANIPCTSQITYQGYTGPFLPTNGITSVPGHPRPILNSTVAAGVITGSNPLSCITISYLELAGNLGSLTWAGASQNFGLGGTGWESNTYNNQGTAFAGTTGGTGSTSIHHIMLQNLVVHDFPGGGLGCAYCDYVTISGNLVYNTALYGPFAYSGISLYESHNIDAGTGTKNYIANNTVFANENLIPNHVSIAFTTTGSGTTSSGSNSISVTSSTGANFTQTVIDTTNGCIPPGTTLGFFGTGFLVLNNSAVTTCNITGSTTLIGSLVTDGEGIIIDDLQNTQSDNVVYVGRTLVTNNVVFGNGSSGLQCTYSNNCDFTFNTAYQNQQSANLVQELAAAPGELNDQNTNGSNFYNNALLANSTQPSAWDRATGTTTWANNAVTSGNAGVTIPGTGNVTAAAMMVNPTISLLTTNFQLLPGSPLIGAGSTSYSRAADIAGNPGIFLAAPDIGAYAQPCSAYGTAAYLQTPGTGAACRSR